MHSGVVTAAFGRRYEVTLSDGRSVAGLTRGKKSPYACGDAVTLGPLHDGEAVILAHAPRRSLLYRSDAWKSKIIAANADQIIIVVAVEPSFAAELVSRALVAAADQRLRSVIILNKIDLIDKLAAARAQLAPFTALGAPLLELCARSDISALQPWLAGRRSVLLGQSGMGKSTLINAMAPQAAALTREISTALDAGKHTTTHARMYDLGDGASIIDSPGLQEFGLAHLSRGEIELGFSEFLPHLAHCRFRDCRHAEEPGCAILAAVAAGDISPVRLKHFHAIVAAATRQ